MNISYSGWDVTSTPKLPFQLPFRNDHQPALHSFPSLPSGLIRGVLGKVTEDITAGVSHCESRFLIPMGMGWNEDRQTSVTTPVSKRSSTRAPFFPFSAEYPDPGSFREKRQRI
ncbi:hypothetical protein CDAR_528721 [Caerostris darwini]|uniref:Uncharacterized protein n=1 Tax=Caerostris darwini TaxID=1538125 RepID=A0AAV4UPK5_9ARAC|nr:hypothetical protein CDAR_528721 [Caerostris darwini]